MDETIAYGIFASYFLLIFVSLGFVLRSVCHATPLERLLEGRPFLFIRTAIASLLCTWFYMFQYMQWSYTNHLGTHLGASVGHWLSNTALFEEAWTIVSSTPERWFVSSGICTWTVIFTFIVWSESGKRDIKHPWAYMLLGQLVAISFSTGLFIVALSLRPRKRATDSNSAALLLVPLLGALVTVVRNPHLAGEDGFMTNLLAMHGLLLVPLFVPHRSRPFRPREEGLSIMELSVYTLLVGAAATIHKSNLDSLATVLGGRRLVSTLQEAVLSHPAQSSISFDVVWVLITLFCWYFTVGSWTTIGIKALALITAIFATWVGYTGVNWPLVASIAPIGALASVGIVAFALGRIKARNETRRKAFMEKIGVLEETVIPGTDKKAPSFAPRRILVGYWHPYCNSGGGGERVLWTAIAHTQKTRPEVISLVYSGDYPTASKREILAKINDRFSIKLDPATLYFIPLPSRYLVDDTYWSHFTLLGQSLGSIRLVWEGLCGKDGLWGDIFLDTMGYAFTYPIVRLIAGSDIVIGAYTHYPTVSADMVKRVREQAFGVENMGGSKSWIRTQVKLMYYRIFTALYASCLLFSEYTMANSSWTHAHLVSLLNKGRQSFLSSLLLMDDKSFEKNGGEKPKCEVLYPPCDTSAFTGFGLKNRSKDIVSLAQFRPEKEHSKQIEALACLFDRRPDLKTSGVKLVMMGGARHPTDEARVENLRRLARERGVEGSVEFVVNAPYGEVVRRLGNASLGLNTMQDEHFGINVVEFMAAGLIPIVHASAGPLLDIVVPLNGQRTGFHAKTPEEFASVIEEALGLSESQDGKMRKAARQLAVQKFSEESFGKGWSKGWTVLEDKTRRRQTASS